MNDFDRRSREAAIRRSASRSQILETANEQAQDWSARCGYCGELLAGTIAQLKAHRCPEYEATLNG